MLDQIDEVGCGGTVGRIVAPVSVEEMPVRRDDEISAELQHVFPLRTAARTPAPQDEAEVSDDDAPAEKHRPAPAFQTEVAVGDPVGVAYRREGKRCGRYRFGPRRGDDQYVHPGRPDLVETFSHLHEVRQAGDSAQMAEEDEQQRAGKPGETDRSSVGPQECQVGHGVTDSE